MSDPRAYERAASCVVRADLRGVVAKLREARVRQTILDVPLAWKEFEDMAEEVAQWLDVMRGACQR